MKSPRLGLFALLSVLALTLTACGSAPGESSQSESSSAAASSAPESAQESQAEPSTPDTTRLYYFYDEVCASCDPRSEFFDLVRDRTQGVTLPEDYDVSCYNTFTDQTDILNRVCDAFGIPEDDRQLPLFVSSEGYASGETAITQQLRHLICTHYGLEDGKTLWYYYRPTCPDCERIEDFFNDTFAANPSFSVIWVDTTDPEPKAAFKALLTEMQVPEEEWQVPFLLCNDRYLSGVDAILENLPDFLAP